MTITKHTKKDINRYISIIRSSKEPTPDVIETILKEKISSNAKILELGCGEGRDAIFLLDKNYDILAIDYSNTVIEKCKELSNYNYNDKFKQFDIFEDEINTFIIGEAIKEARKKKQLTQEQLGNLVGVKKEQISKIESGKNLTLNTISRVLHAMGLQAHLNIPSVGQYAL